ncbi:MAG: hypothetical protein KGY70_20020 [Bacteroidales bacterium]|nr:hypothetical protein [Bacteroidales bacterium]
MSKQVRENDVPCMSEELEMEEEFCDICGERCGGEGYRGPGEVLCNKCACEKYDQPAPPEEEAEELARQHWSYVEGIIVRADPEIGPGELDMIKYHFLTAFKQGHKYGREYSIDHPVMN